MFTKFDKANFFKRWAGPFLIFLLALLVRLPGLGEFLTIDEYYWIEGSYQFLGGLLFADYECPPTHTGRPFTGTGKQCTYYQGHPGVTTTWGGSLGLLLYYWQNRPGIDVDLRTFLETLPTNKIDPSLIAPVRLPMVMVAALFVIPFYVLTKRLFNERVALIAALLVVLSPFHIALSRVLHHDAMTTTFMVLSVLIMTGYWLRGWPWYWLLISGVCAGFAFLSKSVGWFLMPYAAMVGLLSLYLCHQQEKRWVWRKLWRLVGEGTVWGLTAWLTFAAFFPAMWVIPIKTIQGVIGINFNMADAGHPQYFLGNVSLDPGPLFYPVGWLVRASPLEIIGLLILPVVVWHSYRLSSTTSFPRYIVNYPVMVALTLFLVLFLLFETIPNKKIVRYFLPAFPIIDIFIAYGLLWLIDTMSKISYLQLIRQWTVPILSTVILLSQGWLVLNNYPYYFTYYNPLFGGVSGAAHLITIVGWGEGLNEAAAYLNQQPNAESLNVATWYNTTFKLFFIGKADKPARVGDIMNSDYWVYYCNQIQRNLQNMDVWHYLQRSSTPIHRITLHGLDYVLIYQNPIQHHIDWKENGLPGVLTIFGYNIPSDGNLTLFWQNLGLDNNQELWAGLTPATGGEIEWLACPPAPNLATEVNIPRSIIESLCPLATLDAPTNLYDLHLGLGDRENLLPIQFPAGRLALSIDPSGQFSVAEQSTSLTWLLEQERPAEAVPLDITFGSMIQLVGYQFEPTSWQPGQTGKLILYWRPLQEPDLGLAGAFELVLQLSGNEAKEPVLTSIQPMFTDLPTTQPLKRGAVIPMQYPVSVPVSLPSEELWLDICLTVAANGQTIAGTVSNSSKSIECVSLPVAVNPS